MLPCISLSNYTVFFFGHYTLLNLTRSQGESRNFPVTEQQIYDKPHHANSVWKQNGEKLTAVRYVMSFAVLIESAFEGSY